MLFRSILLGLYGSLPDRLGLMEHEENVFPIPVTKVMNKKPKVAESDELGSAVVYRMETHGIISMPVLGPNKKIVGVVHLHDLMRAGVV